MEPHKLNEQNPKQPTGTHPTAPTLASSRTLTPDSNGEVMVSGRLLHTRTPAARADEAREALATLGGRKPWAPRASRQTPTAAAAASTDALLTILVKPVVWACVSLG